MPHEVKLEVFEGPIDLLLHLITRQRVDIYEVSIATITDEYVAALRAVDRIDLEVATGFLLVAATLLELKSARLLPRSVPDGEIDPALLEERDLLLARLVECATYREAGRALQVALERGGMHHPRCVPLEAGYADLTADVILQIDLPMVLAAATRVLTPKPQPGLDLSHVQPLLASVKDAIVAIAHSLRDRAAVGFDELCSDAATRIDVVVRFLGLLELYKAGAIEISQHDRFGDIEATWTGDAELEAILSDVEAYAGGTIS